MKILKSRAKSFYKLKNIKLLKRNITGLREDSIGTFHKKRNRDTVRFLAFDAAPQSGTIVRFDIKFNLSVFVTVALLPTFL